ncbi:hypothetical protein KP509_08G070400 [Ceratopteris richardii]|uniref:Uncharacterized protein n=1 Tax=Ceratopteris richardii TaxID=49495 RepID=A0A8T2U7R6_CERRI|nr:hypothetical protein KP509_08G070400 [Ceratopteris richardii]
MFIFESIVCLLSLSLRSMLYIPWEKSCKQCILVFCIRVRRGNQVVYLVASHSPCSRVQLE